MTAAANVRGRNSLIRPVQVKTFSALQTDTFTKFKLSLSHLLHNFEILGYIQRVKALFLMSL